MTTFFVIVLVLVIIAAAAAYVIKAKKSGAKCIGCPYGDSCGKRECTCHRKDK
ncbi:MAG: FeoB-associated Cys-rich membrane protein [Oscillospiraceae bacterium]|nr:FeoB-associated Cys-rich membrane protein [Oscillospiraceae bacterium]